MIFLTVWIQLHRCAILMNQMKIFLGQTLRIEISKITLVLIAFRLKIGTGLKVFGNMCEPSARHNLATPPSILL